MLSRIIMRWSLHVTSAWMMWTAWVSWANITLSNAVVHCSMLLSPPMYSAPCVHGRVIQHCHLDKKGEQAKLNICYKAPSRQCHLSSAQVHGTHQAALHIPALYLPSRSRYSFTEPERMEGWVSPGPGCKEQLANGCYATASWTWTYDLAVAGRVR